MATEQDKARKILRDAIGADKEFKRELTQIPYPFGGVSETYGFSNQEPVTSRDERNMRSFDVQTGRMRGSQRAGLGRYGDGNEISGTNKIDALGSVTREINPYLWTESHSVIFAEDPDGASDYCTDVVRDLFGTYYALGNEGDVHILNRDGGEIDKISTQIWRDTSDADPNTTLYATTVAVDGFQNVFVGLGPVLGNVNELYATVSCYEHRVDGTYAKAWSVNPNMFVLDIQIYGLDMFVWGVTVDQGDDHVHQYKLLRYAEYKLDEAPTVEANSTYTTAFDSGDYAGTGDALDNYVGRCVVTEDGTVYATASRYGGQEYTSVGQLGGVHLVQAGIWKLQPISATATIAVWAHIYDYTHENQYNRVSNVGALAERQGFGIGVALAKKKDDDAATHPGATRLWMWGGSNYANGAGTYANYDQPRVRLMIDDPVDGLVWKAPYDDGAGGDPYGDVCWAKFANGGAGARDFGFLHHRHNHRGAVDEDGRLYIPNSCHNPSGSPPMTGVVTTNGKALLVCEQNTVAPALLTIQMFTAAELGRSSPVGIDEPKCIALPLLHPTYDSESDVATTDFIVLGSKVDSSDQAIVVGLEMAKGAITTDGFREIKSIALCDRKFFKLSSSGSATLLTDPDAAAILFSNGSKYIQAAVGGGHIYITDGERYFDFNPKDDFIHELNSESYGEIPKRARLLEFWRNRLVLARTDNLPGTWHMSRAGDVHDWNQYPQTPDSAQPVSGTTARAGLCPDSINAIVPYTDDALWFGCDSSIWQMTGDPSSEGGAWDMKTDEVGMSFGRPFCKDDSGVLWFFGSKGGLYTWDGTLKDMAKGRIRRRLRDIDLGTYFIRLAYNYADDGIHIFVCPFGSPVTPIDHYFYDKRTGSFHIDRFGTGIDKFQPTSAIVIDGDVGSDRAVLLGGGDGRIRRWGSGAAGVIPKSDMLSASDDRAIDSYVLIGPIADVHDMSEAALSELAMVLAPNYSGIHLEIFSTDTPDNLGDPVWRGEIHAGRNANQLVRVSGDSIYLRLRNATLDEHWALEKASAILSYGGQIRSSR